MSYDPDAAATGRRHNRVLMIIVALSILIIVTATLLGIVLDLE